MVAEDVLVEYNGSLLAVGAADARRFLDDRVIVTCSTCRPPCGYHHIAPDRVADPVLAAGRPILRGQGRDRRDAGPDAPLVTIQSSHTEHP